MAGDESSAQTNNAPDVGAKPRRSTVACRRCRRLRTKCIHTGAPPCDSCRTAGAEVATECHFARRGEKDVDREFRIRPRKQVAQGVSPQQPTSFLGNQPTPVNSSSFPASVSPTAETLLLLAGQRSENLPPRDEIVEGCRVFTTSYFQLGFLPKSVFLERLARDEQHSISKFLIVSILSISARFTPSLVHRYGSASNATDIFMKHASRMVPEEMYEPSLERVQGFFLLAIAEWGNGDKNRSSMHMGIAVRMAALLKLHREETYQLPAHAAAEDIVQAESARRTFWMIQSQENLHSGHSTPVSFSPEDITALLPCTEADFAFGLRPETRAALPRTPPARADPRLLNPVDRSLFATLIQAHNLWGQVARRACQPERESLGSGPTSAPWEETSDDAQLMHALRDWEAELPARHEWSVWNLRGWKAESLHLAYLSIVMVLRLSNIVTRRIYMEDIVLAITEGSGGSGGAPPGFWQLMSDEIFSNVLRLHEQIDAYFSMRTQEEGFPAILVFCIYICGSLASHLWKYPQLCEDISGKAEEMAMRSLQILTDLHHAWYVVFAPGNLLFESWEPLDLACRLAFAISAIIRALETIIYAEQGMLTNSSGQRHDGGSSNFAKSQHLWARLRCP